MSETVRWCKHTPSFVFPPPRTYQIVAITVSIVEPRCFADLDVALIRCHFTTSLIHTMSEATNMPHTDPATNDLDEQSELGLSGSDSDSYYSDDDDVSHNLSLIHI